MSDTEDLTGLRELHALLNSCMQLAFVTLDLSEDDAEDDVVDGAADALVPQQMDLPEAIEISSTMAQLLQSRGGKFEVQRT
jgi:hypothetical protein